jgi:hypothetical protein
MAPKKAPSLASALKGRWRIEAMDLWDRDAIDLVEPGFIAFNGEEGEMRFIACAPGSTSAPAPATTVPSRSSPGRASTKAIHARVVAGQC